MKRTFIAVMSVFIALTVAGSAFAIEFDVSGSLRFQGIYNENASSQDSDKPDSYRNMRLRVRTDMKITDKINLITRFDALDKVLSSDDSAFTNSEDDDNIDFDRAYMRIVSPIGLFMVGRMEGVTWGTPFADDEDDTDRITYVLPIDVGSDKLYIAAVGEKVNEEDKGYAETNKDNDKYYISATYKSEDYKGGFLLGFYHFNTFQDPGQAKWYSEFTEAGGADAVTAYVMQSNIATAASAASTAAVAAAQNVTAAATEAALDGNAAQAAYYVSQADAYVAQATYYGTEAAVAQAIMAEYADAAVLYAAMPARGATAKAKVWLLAPYFTGKFGMLGITTELDYVTGTAKYEVASADDRDVSAYTFNFEVTGDVGPATLQLGFATSSGDSDYDDDKVESMGYVSPGVDWEKMFILCSDEHGMNTTLGGGLGNYVGDGFASYSVAMLDGYQMIYAGADYKYNDDLKLGVIGCITKADDVPAGVDDDQGFELDLSLSWTFMEKLEYTAIAAYLSAGDYWKDRSGLADIEDTYSLYHKLELSF